MLDSCFFCELFASNDGPLLRWQPSGRTLSGQSCLQASFCLFCLCVCQFFTFFFSSLVLLLFFFSFFSSSFPLCFSFFCFSFFFFFFPFFFSFFLYLVFFFLSALAPFGGHQLLGLVERVLPVALNKRLHK